MRDLLSIIASENFTTERIEILQIHPDILTLMSITPSMLEEQFSYKLTIRGTGINTYLSLFKEALKNTKINPSNTSGDIKWGIILYNSAGKRVMSMYVDRFGTDGYINSTPVTFRSEANKGLLWWLESNFLGVFK